eukprot:Trichotokara_eunicae@DN6293_c0_g1_i3.p1
MLEKVAQFLEPELILGCTFVALPTGAAFLYFTDQLNIRGWSDAGRMVTWTPTLTEDPVPKFSLDTNPTPKIDAPIEEDSGSLVASYITKVAAQQNSAKSLDLTNFTQPATLPSALAPSESLLLEHMVGRYAS